TQVLPRRPVSGCRRPGRSPGFRIILLPTPSRLGKPFEPVAFVGFVPDYSDGVAADSHRLPWRPHAAGHPDIVYDTATLTEPDWTRQAEGRYFAHHGGRRHAGGTHAGEGGVRPDASTVGHRQPGDATPWKELCSHAEDVTLFGGAGGYERGWE